MLKLFPIKAAVLQLIFVLLQYVKFLLKCLECLIFTVFFFLSDRSEEHIKIVEAYLLATKQLRDYNGDIADPVFSESVSLDLSTIVSSVSGPKRPNDRVSVTDMKNDFLNCLTNKVCSFSIFSQNVISSCIPYTILLSNERSEMVLKYTGCEQNQ